MKTKPGARIIQSHEVEDEAGSIATAIYTLYQEIREERQEAALESFQPLTEYDQ